MISLRKLIKMAKKWHNRAAMQRKRISFPRKDENVNVHSCSTLRTTVVDKGNFVIYTADKKRFVIPLACLNNEVFRQLLEMSEEEFGLPSGGPITLPFDSVFIDYIISFIKRGIAEDLQKALLMSLTTNCCCSLSSSILQQEWRNQQLLVY